MATDTIPPLPEARAPYANGVAPPAAPGPTAEELRRQARADLDSLPDWALDDVAEWLEICAEHCRRFPLDGLPPLPPRGEGVSYPMVIVGPPVVNTYPTHVELD